MTQCLLNDTAIGALISKGAIKVPGSIEERLQPASLDIRLGEEAFFFAKTPLPQKDLALEKMALQYQGQQQDLGGKGAVLKPEMVAIVKLQEALALPDGIMAKTNPKSSVGRLDLFVRVFGERRSLFDEFPPNYQGALYAYIKASSFPMRLRRGLCLTQIRFCRDNPANATSDTHSTEKEIIPVHIALTGKEPSIFRSRETQTVMNFAAKQPWEPFFQVLPSCKELHLKAGRFYLLCSQETLTIPPDKAGELQPYDPRIGELRTHYAGFLDPGFCGKLIFEVRAHETLIITDGQHIGHIIMEPMCAQPKRLYGDRELQSSYQKNNSHLTKYFRSSRTR